MIQTDVNVIKTHNRLYIYIYIYERFLILTRQNNVHIFRHVFAFNRQTDRHIYKTLKHVTVTLIYVFQLYRVSYLSVRLVPWLKVTRAENVHIVSSCPH